LEAVAVNSTAWGEQAITVEVRGRYIVNCVAESLKKNKMGLCKQGATGQSWEEEKKKGLGKRVGGTSLFSDATKGKRSALCRS